MHRTRRILTLLTLGSACWQSTALRKERRDPGYADMDASRVGWLTSSSSSFWDFETLEAHSRAMYHYMPEERVLICGCAKCGSTSLYRFIYEQVFGKSWNYTDVPYIQNVESERWAGKFEVLGLAEAQEHMNAKDIFSFALTRDPKERLISAWRSKVACDEKGTDLQDRARIVPRMLEMAGWEQATCLSFDDFVKVVYAIHRRGRAEELDAHLMPQRFGCFKHFAPELWSKVTSVAEPSAAEELYIWLGGEQKLDFPRLHVSAEQTEVAIESPTMKLLSAVTAGDYAILGRFAGQKLGSAETDTSHISDLIQ